MSERTGGIQGPTAPSVPELLDRITTWPDGMPVRLMEQVIQLGAPVIPEIADALARWRDDEQRDLLWLIAILGEIGGTAAVAPLITQMARAELDLAAQAAVEGLAKLGAAAVPALVDVARTGDLTQRLYAYAGLGWIDDEAAYAALVDALRRDTALADVIANALAAHGRQDALANLFEAYATCEPWQRPDLEAAIAALERGHRPERRWTRDWRLRYRRRPELSGRFELDWLGTAVILRGDESMRRDRATSPLRTREEILADGLDDGEPTETCEDCGAPVENSMGILVCPHTAVHAGVFQASVLQDAREASIEDLFDLLDQLEAAEFDLRDAPLPSKSRARRERDDALADLMEARATVEWLIASGVEDVAAGEAVIAAALPRVAERYGDPDRLLTPTAPARSRGQKIGRNDPCPCGSGRKYKRCCLDRADGAG